MHTIPLSTIKLQPGKDRRLLKGHRWIFSNEIAGSLKGLAPGWVRVESSAGTALGIGYLNPHTLIAVRMVCPPGQEPSADFFRESIVRARQRRACLYPGSDTLRVIFGESDGLPGLIVDQYGPVLVYQITTVGMSLIEPLIQELLIEIFKPAAIVARGNSKAREIEGLELNKSVVYGQVPEPLLVNIHGLSLEVDPLEGQKTGLFLDQRDNREALRRWVHGKQVLDLFCYEGHWSLVAAQAGAAGVTGVDQSARAVARCRANSARNALSACRFEQTDALSYLKGCGKAAFDVIVLDPPAFAKTKAALPEAMKGYIDFNRRVLLALRPGGILVSCSCSYHMSAGDLELAVLRAAQAAGKNLRLLEARGQALDHPALLAMPETRYLKCLILEAL